MPDLSFRNFDVRLQPKGSRRPARAFRTIVSSHLGATASFDFRAPFTQEMLEAALFRESRLRGAKRRRGEIANPTTAEEFGGLLFKALFAGPVNDSFRAALAAARQNGEGLRLRFALTASPELAGLPWELLYDPEARYFLTKWNLTSVVRYPDSGDPPKPLAVAPPIRILVVLSNPHDDRYDRLDVEQEWSRLQKAVRARPDSAQLTRLERATVTALRQELQTGRHHVLHFVGHGSFEESRDQSTLILEDEEGRADAVKATELGELLRNASTLRLVVLNCCEGGHAGLADPFAGAAQMLIHQGVPAVVAMQFEISDDASIAFTEEFYRVLALGDPVDVALTQARVALRSVRFALEWATPVLYMRSDEGRLFDLRRAVPGEETPAAVETPPDGRSVTAAVSASPSVSIRSSEPSPAAIATPIVADSEVEAFHLLVTQPLDESPDRSGGSPKHAQVLATYGGSRVTATMRLRAGKGEAPTPFGRVIMMHERIKAFTNRERGALPGEHDLIQFGGELFETLLQGDVRRLYDEARILQRQRRLDFVLTSMVPWIAEKPWEFAYDTGRRSFLATESVHFIRGVMTNVQADRVVWREGPLRILVAAAQPVGFGRLSIEQEVAIIRRGFEPLIESGLVAVEVLARATPTSLSQHVSSGGFQVVHFIGHCVYDEARREGSLVFENDRGGAFVLGAQALGEIFCKRGLGLMFLSACSSGRGGQADFNKGVAQSLVVHGLPALVANQYLVCDSSATFFAQAFYQAIAMGSSVGDAARDARIAVRYSLHGEHLDWAVPVLYARDPAMRLCAPKPGVPSTPRTMARSSQGARPTQVAVWDVDDVFPSLARTLDVMNNAQAAFGFVLADVTAPLDVWDVDEAEGRTFLWADRVARRLQNKAAQLGADALACVTRHWLRDEEWLNLYGWWPDQGLPPIVIHSLAGFDELPVEGTETDRAIANALVASLAGLYGQAPTHEGGARDCPLSFGERRDYARTVGTQRFDAACRRRLKPRLGPKLEALDALLAAFD
jgi:CHAT domain-containing protein